MEGWLCESRAHPNDHLDYLEHAMSMWQTFNHGFTRNNPPPNVVSPSKVPSRHISYKQTSPNKIPCPKKMQPPNFHQCFQNWQNCASTLFLYLKVPTTYPVNLVQLFFFPPPLKFP